MGKKTLMAGTMMLASATTITAAGPEYVEALTGDTKGRGGIAVGGISLYSDRYAIRCPMQR